MTSPATDCWLLTCDQQGVKVYLRDEVRHVQTVGQNILNLGGKQAPAGARVEVEVEVNVVHESLRWAKLAATAEDSRIYFTILPFQ